MFGYRTFLIPDPFCGNVIFFYIKDPNNPDFQPSESGPHFTGRNRLFNFSIRTNRTWLLPDTSPTPRPTLYMFGSEAPQRDGREELAPPSSKSANRSKTTVEARRRVITQPPHSAYQIHRWLSGWLDSGQLPGTSRSADQGPEAKQLQWIGGFHLAPCMGLKCPWC